MFLTKPAITQKESKAMSIEQITAYKQEIRDTIRYWQKEYKRISINIRMRDYYKGTRG